jgi:dolichol kinase
MIAFTWVFLCKYLYNTWHFVLMPLTFIAITIVSVKYRLIKIVERKSHAGRDIGIVHYAVSMTLVCLVAKLFPPALIPCGIGVFALSFGDGFAAIFGQAIKKMNRSITKTKTAAGTAACFVFSIVGIAVSRIFVPFPVGITQLAAIGLTAALMELVGGRYDNYTVPIGTAAAAWLMGVGEV